MSYKTFIKALAVELKRNTDLPDELNFSAQKSINGIVSHTLTIKSKDVNITPCIHLDHYYLQFLDGKDVSEIAQSIREIYLDNPGIRRDDLTLSWERVKDYISYELINYERNAELLEDFPHIRLLDLALIFTIDSVFLELGLDGYIRLNSELAAFLGADTKKLLMTAMENTPRLRPVELIKMSDMFRESDKRLMLPRMVIVTNNEKYRGAAAIFDPGFEEKASPLSLSDDTIVLPSSIHETILLLDTVGTYEELAQTINAINNSDAIDAAEYLSYHPYRLGELKRAYKEAVESCFNENDDQPSEGTEGSEVPEGSEDSEGSEIPEGSEVSS